VLVLLDIPPLTEIAYQVPSELLRARQVQPLLDLVPAYAERNELTHEASHGRARFR
jgi:hypothetical protein